MNGRPPRSLPYESVSVGDKLPGLEVPVTRTLVVAGAIASRDYQDVHHDPELARERGSPDVFMNILTTNGFVGRFVTDWSGPAGVLEAIAIRLGAPNYPGDTMVLSGEVTAKLGPSERSGSRGVVEVAVRGANRLGDHVTGTVRVGLPMGRAPDPDTRPSPEGTAEGTPGGTAEGTVGGMAEGSPGALA